MLGEQPYEIQHHSLQSIPVNFSPFFMFELDEDGVISAANEHCLELTGYTYEDIAQGLHISRFLDLEDADQALNNLREIMNGEHACENEYTLVCKNGMKLPVLVYSEPVHGKSGAKNVREAIIIGSRKNIKVSSMQEEHNHSRQLFGSTGFLLLHLDTAGKIMLLNQKGCELLGCQETSALGKDWFETFIPEHHRQQVRESFQKLTKSDNGTESAFYCPVVVTANGDVKMFRWHHAVLKSGIGTVCSILLSGEDITDHTHLEDRVRESEEVFKAIFLAARDGIVLFDARNGKIIDCNPEFERQTGRARENLLGMNAITFLLTDSDQSSVYQALAELETQNNVLRETCFKKPDGTTIYAEYTTKKLSLHGIPCFQSICRDITEKKQTGASVRELEEKTHLLYNTTTQGIIFHDNTGAIIDANPAAQRIFGCSLEQMHRSSNIYEQINWIHEDGSKLTLEELPITIALQTGKPIHDICIGYHHPVLNQLKWMITSAVPLTRPGESTPYLFYAICIDVTDRKIAQEALVESEKKYHRLFESMNQGVIYQDSAGRILDINPAAKNITGYAFDDVHDKAYMKSQHKLFYQDGTVIPFEDLPVNQAIRTGKPVSNVIIKSFNPRLNDYLWTICNATPLFNSGESTPYQVFTTVTDITELHNTMNELLESEEKFSSVFRNSPDMIAIIDRQGAFISVNDSFIRQSGYSREEILGHNVDDLNLWADPGENTRLQKMFLKNKYIISEECEMLKKSRERMPVLFTIFPIKVHGKSCLLSTSHDITQRKKAERLLSENEKRLAHSQELAHVGSWDLEVTSGKLTWTDEVYRIFGLIPGEKPVNFSTFLDMVHPDDRVLVQNTFSARFQPRKGSCEIEHRIIRQDTGETRHIFEKCEHVWDSKGELIRSSGMMRDITEQKRAQEALRESEEKFSVAFHTNPSMMIITSLRDFRYVEVNESYCRESGYARDELVGHYTMDTSLWVDEDEMKSMVETIQKEGKVHGAEYHFRMKSGEVRTWLCSTDTITINGEPCVLAVATDITERKEAEAELELMYETETGLREQLEEEMKRRAEFTRALVHELKTPLTPIAASSEVLAMILTGEPMRSMAENINRGAHNLNKRIDELLELARSELNVLRIAPSHIDLSPLIIEIHSEMTGMAVSHQQKLDLHIPETLGIVNADPARIRQVLENLLTNALKYTPKGGQIVIRARVDGENAIVQVADNGPGLSESEAERVFQPYYRKERDRDHLSGLGLGLALCKTLIDLHGGAIWVETQVEKGSTFSFSLPVVKQP